MTTPDCSDCISSFRQGLPVLLASAFLIVIAPFGAEASRLDLTQSDISGYNVELAKKIVGDDKFLTDRRVQKVEDRVQLSAIRF